MFEWRSADGTALGQLILEAKSGVLDSDMVRTICGSVSFDEKTYPEELTRDQLEAVRDGMRIERKGVTK